MTFNDINIRDPFILNENGTYYLYGTRAKNFGQGTGGFDVYQSTNLETWSAPQCCFDSEANGYNRHVNWAPEVHKFAGSYYMFATFTAESGLRGTYILKSDDPRGPFQPHSDGPVTPKEWECLDGTLYVEADGTPYIVFCHEHTQIIDGTIEYMPLTPDLKAAAGAPKTIFRGSSTPLTEKKPEGEHYVTDGPFLYRTKTGTLLLLWSTGLSTGYAECVARSDNGRIDGHFSHIAPLVTSDGGHGMVFRDADGGLNLIFHTPNRTNVERPCMIALADVGDALRCK